VGRYDVGLLGVRTCETEIVKAKNHFAGRVKRNIFKQSYVGGILTEGNTDDLSSARTHGGGMRLFIAITQLC
jgi:hypothetical protein